MTDWNVIGRRDRAGRPMPCGVIDFGDVTRTLRACELAVAASIAYGHEPDDPICAAAEIVRGFDAVCPLDDAELEVLPHLIAARAAIVAVGTEQQAALEPHNAYAQRVRAGDWAICETAAAQPRAARRRGFCGGPAAAVSPRSPRACPAARGRFRASSPARVVDLSPTGLDPVTAPGAIGAHAEARWHATRELSNDEPETIHLGLDVFAPEGSEVRAPLAGRVEHAGGRELVLAAGGAAVRLAGLVPAVVGGRAASRPEPSSGASEQGRSCRRTCTSRSGRPDSTLPGLVTPARAEAWLALCPHPGALLGLAADDPAGARRCSRAAAP